MGQIQKMYEQQLGQKDRRVISGRVDTVKAPCFWLRHNNVKVVMTTERAE